jgi:hypothetical protein
MTAAYRGRRLEACASPRLRRDEHRSRYTTCTVTTQLTQRASSAPQRVSPHTAEAAATTHIDTSRRTIDPWESHSTGHTSNGTTSGSLDTHPRTSHATYYAKNDGESVLQQPWATPRVDTSTPTRESRKPHAPSQQMSLPRFPHSAHKSLFSCWRGHTRRHRTRQQACQKRAQQDQTHHWRRQCRTTGLVHGDEVAS